MAATEAKEAHTKANMVASDPTTTIKEEAYMSSAKTQNTNLESIMTLLIIHIIKVLTITYTQIEKK